MARGEMEEGGGGVEGAGQGDHGTSLDSGVACMEADWTCQHHPRTKCQGGSNRPMGRVICTQKVTITRGYKLCTLYYKVLLLKDSGRCIWVAVMASESWCSVARQAMVSRGPGTPKVFVALWISGENM